MTQPVRVTHEPGLPLDYKASVEMMSALLDAHVFA